MIKQKQESKKSSVGLKVISALTNFYLLQCTVLKKITLNFKIQIKNKLT